MPGPPRFRLGRLDHVHIMVPDRATAAEWHAEHLGFDAGEHHPMIRQASGVAFSLDAEAFITVDAITPVRHWPGRDKG